MAAYGENLMATHTRRCSESGTRPEWINPRASCSGQRSASVVCQSVSTIRRWCFLPGPCCGKRQGQDFE